MPVYDRAVGRQSLGWMPLVDWGWKAPMRLPENPHTVNYWNSGVNFAYGGRERMVSRSTRSGGDTQLKPRRKRSWFFGSHPEVSPTNLDRATVYMQYGNHQGAKAELGDLFNDIMGAVVPGWSERPQALKNLQLKVDPAKALAAVQKIAPGAGGQAVSAANAAGLNVYVNTPAGRVLITPEMAQGAYKHYPMYTETQSAISGLFESPLTMLAVGGAGLGLFLMMRGK